MAVKEGTLLWEPSEERTAGSNIRRYMDWLEREKGLVFREYHELWRWSVTSLEEFWASIWEFFGVRGYTPYTRVLAERKMPGAEWFKGSTLNYAEHVFRQSTSDRPALLFQSEFRPLQEMSWGELHQQVSSVAAALRHMGVQRGDRVAAYMPNIPETLVAFLACASIGAIWSSCSPDMGTRTVVDRLQQIEPKVLFAVDGYRYGGKEFDRRPAVAELRSALPTLERTFLVPYLDRETDAAGLDGILCWQDLLTETGELTFEPVPFDHPLWVLYSSGTTGLPKGIVQGHGGILLEHLKTLSLHLDLRPGDRFFWFTTTSWMMWNFLIAGLLVGSTVLMFDGSPGYPDMGALWQFAEKTGMTCFGTSAGYVTSCLKAGIEPGKMFDLSKLTSVGSTGSPLPSEGFQWVYEKVKGDIWLATASGGTDVCTAFLGGSPLLPVYATELQCRMLGAKVEAYDEEGRSVVDGVGELVITEPMPSMPLFFWNDPEERRYRESYFNAYPRVWRHGDWVKITPRGSAVIHGRSDATINRMGVRMGTSDIYSVVDDIPEVVDSLVVGVERKGGAYFMPLFVVLQEGVQLDDALRTRIREAIRSDLSPRHVPDEIFAVPQIPRTLNGKKLEVPVKKILMGVPVGKAANPGSVSNPDSIQYFVDFAARHGSHQE